jgi:predicted DNA-binding transcriptional regulator YafY
MSDRNISRLVDLVPYIATHQGVSISELAQTFEVSKKQIENDLSTLFMCGYPFYQPMEVNFEDGFVTISNADELSKVRRLNRIEIYLLLIGLQSMDLFDSDKQKLMVKLSAKIENETTTKLNDDQNIILEAITRHKVLRITYISPDQDRKTEREIIPFEIYQAGGNTYLKAFCFLSQARRTFRLDRIAKIDLTDNQSGHEIPDEVLQEAKTTRIEIIRNSRYISEYFSTKTEIVSYYNEDWMVRSGLSMAGDFVVESNELRAKIARRAQQARYLYD